MRSLLLTIDVVCNLDSESGKIVLFEGLIASDTYTSFSRKEYFIITVCNNLWEIIDKQILHKIFKFG